MSDDPTTRILAAVDVLGSNLELLRGEVGGLREEVGGLRGEVGGLRGDVIRFRAEIMGRIDRLQDAVSSVRDDGIVNFARADRVESIARESADQVRAMGVELSGMHRQIQRLQSDVRGLRGEA